MTADQKDEGTHRGYRGGVRFGVGESAKSLEISKIEIADTVRELSFDLFDATGVRINPIFYATPATPIFQAVCDHLPRTIGVQVGYAEQIAAGEEPHAVTPRGQMNEAIEEKRGLGAYLERGREWLQEMGQRVRDQAELAAHGMASLVQGAARTKRAGLQSSTGDGFDMLTALDQSPRREQTPAIELDQLGQVGRDRQRQRGLDGPDIGCGR